jgi:endonuclease/exonuclease/phosphatase family metal-dependent hydrolase
MDVPCNNAASNWKFRYANIGSGLRAGGVVPDIIALQEVNGWTWCTFDHGFIRDYTPLDRLLSELESGTGVRYRIAYLNALTKVSGNFHCTTEGRSQNACEAVSGLALLYNPNRVRNLMTQTLAADATQAYAHDAPLQEGAHLRRSLPACAPAAGSTVSSRIDEPMQRDKCNQDTPAGLAWVSRDVVALARLEWLERPGAAFHVYNVHLSWVREPRDEHAEHVGVANAAVTALEASFGAARWIPPIIMGDFNTLDNDEATLAEFPQFDYRGRADVNDYILSGKPTSFPAAASITGHISTEMPRVPPAQGGCHAPHAMWSDHCAVLTTITVK